MLAQTLPSSRAAATLDSRILIGMAVAAAVAWLQPFDRLFAALTFGQPVLRAGVIVLIAGVGLKASRHIGLIVGPKGASASLLPPILVAAGVAVACAGVDRLFRSTLSPHYLELMTRTPLLPRVVGFMMRAFNENVIYRLFLGSVLTAGLLSWRPRLGAAAFWLGFGAAQLVNIWANVTSAGPITPIGVFHDLVRYVAPGMVWSWLFWRRGFQANEVASTSVHILFQPLATLWLTH
jgi:hypothetical protein